MTIGANGLDVVMPLGEDESYNAIDVWRAIVKYNLINRLAGEKAWRLVHWTQIACHVEPIWEEKDRLANEESFKLALRLPIQELERVGLVRKVLPGTELFCIDGLAYKIIEEMNSRDADAWALERIYEGLPWLKP